MLVVCEESVKDRFGGHASYEPFRVSRMASLNLMMFLNSALPKSWPLVWMGRPGV
ncbi:MAG: hypothetical protein M2R45_03356 [Verrucomicrobia subdivision 3 bacterium]|nr:hypothetical protein [Limisphaerales bacterium]MCS1416731.1 hypothetical protein [Limisphaerales bacterium]